MCVWTGGVGSLRLLDDSNAISSDSESKLNPTKSGVTSSCSDIIMTFRTFKYLFRQHHICSGVSQSCCTPTECKSWSKSRTHIIPPYPSHIQPSPGCLPIIKEDPGSQRLHMETQVLQDGCKEFVPRRSFRSSISEVATILHKQFLRHCNSESWQELVEWVRVLGWIESVWSQFQIYTSH